MDFGDGNAVVLKVERSRHNIILSLLFLRGYSVPNCQSWPFVPTLASLPRHQSVAERLASFRCIDECHVYHEQLLVGRQDSYAIPIGDCDYAPVNDVLGEAVARASDRCSTSCQRPSLTRAEVRA